MTTDRARAATPTPTSPRAAGLLALALGLALAPGAGTAAAQGRPTPARLAPADGLVALVEYDGVDGPGGAWKGTAAYAILNTTPAGEALVGVARQVVDRLLKDRPPGAAGAADLVGVADHLARRGFLLAAYGDGRALLGVPGLGAPASRPLVDALLRSLDIGVGRARVASRSRGRELSQVAPATPDANAPAAPADASTLTWWAEGDDLVLADGRRRGPGAAAPAEPGGPVDTVAAVLDAADGKAPAAATHPSRLAALAEGRAVAGFAPNGLFVVEQAGGALLGDLIGQADAVPIRALGLDGAKRVVGRWGFRGRALLTAVRVEAPAPRVGLLALLDQPRLRVDALPPIPRAAGAVAIGMLDPGPALDALVGALKAADPGSAPAVDAALAEADAAVRAATGLRLRADLLAQLGPSWCAYSTRVAIGAAAPVPVPTVVVAVRDRAAVAAALDAAVAHLNEVLRGPVPAGGGGEAPALAFEPLPAPERGYRLASPGGVVPWLGPDVRPTILLGAGSVVAAMNPDLARAALAAEARPDARWAPAGEVAATLAALPPGLTSLSVGDPADSPWPELLATLPLTAQYLGNLLGAADAPAEPPPGSALLALLGVPAPGGFRIRVDPDRVPTAAQVRPHLFPSVLATIVDDRGLLFLGAEALPLGCVGGPTPPVGANNKATIDLTPFLRR